MMSGGGVSSQHQCRRQARERGRGLDAVAALADEPEEAILLRVIAHHRIAIGREGAEAAPGALDAGDLDDRRPAGSARCLRPASCHRHRRHAGRRALHRRARRAAFPIAACSTRSRPRRRPAASCMKSTPSGPGTTAMERRLGCRPTGFRPAISATTSPQAPAALTMIRARNVSLPVRTVHWPAVLQRVTGAVAVKLRRRAGGTA